MYNHKVTNNTINAIIVRTDINQHYVTPCIVLDISENLQLIENKCTKLNYTIGFPTDNLCELFLKLASDSDDNINIFYIWQLTSPTGFIKIDKRCQCDPVLVQYDIINCNINDQTILRPANSWISATTHNNSCTYTYHISLHCPFHYCLPHSYVKVLPTLTYPLLTHSVSLTDLVSCGDIVNKVSALPLALLIVNIIPISIYFSSYLLQ